MKKKDITGRCSGCEFVRMVSGGGWSFPACYHKPYDGKWTREIKTCPIGKRSWYESK